MKDITGQRFGMLTVIERAGKVGTVQIIKCKCDCGNETLVRYPNLTSGTTTSCGCYKSKTTSARRIKDLTGMKFGQLTVLERHSKIGGSKVLWECKCSYGRKTLVSGSNLKSGNTTSCGCMRESINESVIVKILNELNVKYEKEAKFSDLLSPSGNPLRFDFKIYTTDGFFLLEYQGLQHFQSDNVLYGKLSRDYSDKKKKEYCEAKGISLEEIWYGENTEESLLLILDKYTVMHDNTVPSSKEEKV